MSDDARGNLESWIAGMDRCTLYRGHARFETANTVRVGDDLLTRRENIHQHRRPCLGA